MGTWGRVVSVTELNRLDRRGDVQTMFRYECETARGIRFHMDIPESDANEATVRDRASKRAAELDKTLGV